MVKIRLAHTGKKHRLSYRFVVIDSRKKRDGQYIEKLGSYNPHTQPPTIKINKKRLKFWQSVGAQPTQRVRSLLKI